MKTLIPTSNHQWTRIDTNSRNPVPLGFPTCLFVSIRMVFCLIAAAMLPLAAPAADSPSVLLQKAIFAEETEGNVDAAITLYEQIAAEAATNRAVVAQAQYRLAVCYQKKGNKEQAIKLLNELVQQSPTDAAMKKKARETLIELGAPASEGVTIRKLPLSVGWVWAVSRDGRYVAYEPPVGTNLCIYETATGKNWVAFKGTDDTEPWDVVFSPDNRQIAYSVRGAKIWVANIDGAEPRLLYEDKKARKNKDALAGRTWFAGWSATSGQILLNSWDEGTALELNPKTGAAKEYARLGPPDRTDWLPSANGEWAARFNKDYPRSITLLNLRSNHEEPVIKQDAVNLFGWIANDAKLVYSKARTGGTDLWAIAVKSGMSVGVPEMIWSNLGDVSVGGITNDGTVYYFTKEKYPAPKNLWVMEGLFTRAVPTSSDSFSSKIPTEELIAPNSTILDRNLASAPQFLRAGRSAMPCDATAERDRS